MRLLYGIIDTMDMSLSKLREIVKDREAWHVAVHGVAKSRTCLGDWTTMFHRRCRLLHVLCISWQKSSHQAMLGGSLTARPLEGMGALFLCDW